MKVSIITVSLNSEKTIEKQLIQLYLKITKI